jgi:hypothetical protein
MHIFPIYTRLVFVSFICISPSLNIMTPLYTFPNGTIDGSLEKLVYVHQYLDRIMSKHVSGTLNVFQYHELVLRALNALVSLKFLFLFASLVV